VLKLSKNSRSPKYATVGHHKAQNNSDIFRFIFQLRCCLVDIGVRIWLFDIRHSYPICIRYKLSYPICIRMIVRNITCIPPVYVYYSNIKSSRPTISLGLFQKLSSGKGGGAYNTLQKSEWRFRDLRLCRPKYSIEKQSTKTQIKYSCSRLCTTLSNDLERKERFDTGL